MAEEILVALDTRSVTVPGSNAAEIVLPKLTDFLKDILQQRTSIGEDVARLLDAHPLSRALMSMPGVGVRTAALILLEVGGGSAFASAPIWRPTPEHGAGRWTSRGNESRTPPLLVPNAVPKWYRLTYRSKSWTERLRERSTYGRHHC